MNCWLYVGLHWTRRVPRDRLTIGLWEGSIVQTSSAIIDEPWHSKRSSLRSMLSLEFVQAIFYYLNITHIYVRQFKSIFFFSFDMITIMTCCVTSVISITIPFTLLLLGTYVYILVHLGPVTKEPICYYWVKRRET